GTPPSACFNTAIICASLYRTFFIVNLLRYLAEKILLLNNTNFRGDYRPKRIVNATVPTPGTTTETSIVNTPPVGLALA
ncbi:MAG: hypothetical protein ABJT31_11175, partial [Hyphomicrobiales bacterium]